MDAQGQFGFERVFDSQGREFVSSPQYARSLPLSSVQLNVPPESRATWYTTSFVNSGYLEFKPHAEDKVISVCQMHRVVFTTHCLEDVNNEVDGDMKFQVKDLPTRDDFYPALHGMIKHKLEWGPQYQFYGRATFETGVAEWTKRVMSDFGDILHKEKIYGVVGISRYPYECCPNIWRAFCELCWGPLCNTFHHGNGEMGISLYDMKGICGLPILGDVQYEEFIPQNKDLQQNGVYPPAITELLKIHSQLCIYHNQSTVSWAQWIGHFYQEKIIYKASGDGKRKLQGQTLKAPEITLHISKEGRVAAFLAFWLSRFVLPSVDRNVRPETFHMACLMAQGVRVSLAPTILGYIYNGLGEIATHPKGPGSSSASFPIHYVIGWLGEHMGLYVPQTDKGFVKDYPFLVRYAGVKPKDFRLNRARIIFRRDKELIYRPTTFIEDEGRSFADKKDLSNRKFEFLVCKRYALLPARVNNNLWLEPYYPNTFAREFGFDKGVPSDKLSFSVHL
ncbi:unnamed protein product [Prunus armeniaca]